MQFPHYFCRKSLKKCIIKKAGKKIIKWLGYFLLFWLLLMLVLSIPAVQTRLAKFATDKINEDFGTNIVVKKLDLSFLGSVQLKGVEIRDHHKDTLIFVDKLSTSILNAKRILDNNVNLADVSLNGVHLYMKTYKDEIDDSMTIFIDTFDDNQPKDSTSTPFILRTDNIYVDNLTYKLIDENKKEPVQFSATNAGGNLQDFFLEGPNISTKIRGLYLVENRGVKVTNLTTDFTYTTKQMKFVNTTLQTDNDSYLKAEIEFNYDRKDFRYFTDKVQIKADFDKSKLSARDLHKFYGEIRGNETLYFTGKINGPINNFSADNVNLYSNSGLKIVGNMAFVNALNSQRGFIFDGDLDNVTANYQKLKNLLPNVLGKTLPSDFEKLGTFTLSGLVRVTPDQMDATLAVESEIGNINSDLQLSNIDNIDNAAYSGEVAFRNFDVGVFANDSILGKISLKADVQGEGFTIENINTTIIGTISELEFNNYTYKELDVNGQFQNKKFDGILNTNDQNLKMKFEGLADLSKEVYEFDFKAAIENLDLQKTNLFTRDSISIIKGEIAIDVDGNTLDDIIGKATFKDMVYTNQKKEYGFKEFNLTSSIKDSIKSIKIDSKDIVDGELTGKFTFDQLLPMAQNALGSVYTNYNPYPVKPNQFIDFDFKIYNQIVDIFLPQVSVAKNTHIKGKIKSDQNSLRLTFSSPKIDAYDVVVDKFLLRMDNKNPLYNTHLTADNINTKYYNVNKLNLLNRTVNDTLYFKSIFNGGKENSEKFNLDFFYTINQNRKSVVGIQKSTFNYREFDWVINPQDNKSNKVTFDIKNNEFTFSPFSLISDEQKINFEGALKGDNYKDLQANFTKVKLASFLPPIDSLALKGELSGVLDFTQNNGVYSPKGNLAINNFSINDFEQGDLALQVEGENSLEKYAVNLSLENENSKSIAATGKIDFSSKRPELDLNVFLKEYQIAAFSPLGEEVLSKLRGSVSGDFTAKGFLGNPDFNGVLNFKDAGLTFPYLNVDFDLKGNTSVRLKDQSFILSNIFLEDTKHKTQGTLNGSITHQNFKQWFLNLDIDTNNLLILDTQDKEEVQYYGTGFLDGDAKIRGLTSNLTIDVNGKTNPGTVFVIPLSDIKTIDNYKLIHFKSEGTNNIEELNVDDIKGLNLNINLDVTKDAVAQVVIDKASGSDLKGSGTGNLDIRINTRGKFNMFGDFEIDNGVYNFKYGGIINKPFVVQKGGTISWNGNPYEAELDLTAIFRTKANPANLLDNVYSNRKIDIDLYTKITGGLFSSQQEFDIKIPSANSTIASELEFKLNENDLDTKLKHFGALLAFGTFYNEENLGNSAVNGLTSTASDVLGGVLSSILNSKDGRFQVGLGYTQGDRSNLNDVNIDDQVDVSVSTRLSDRVIVNGKVGIPVGANTQTSVAGDVNVEILLNEEGNFRGKAFNRQNEIQYSALEEEGYTQGIGLSYQVNFNTMSELLQKLGLKKKDTIKKVVKKDSILTPRKKLINFK